MVSLRRWMVVESGARERPKAPELIPGSLMLAALEVHPEKEHTFPEYGFLWSLLAHALHTGRFWQLHHTAYTIGRASR